MKRLTSIACADKAWYILSLCAIELRCCPETIKNTSVSLTVALNMSLHYAEHEHCSLFWINPTHSTLPCCCKYSQEHQMCINPQVKIVPNKCTIYSCLSHFRCKLQCPAELQHIFVYIFSKNWAWGHRRGRKVVLRDGQTHYLLTVT